MSQKLLYILLFFSMALAAHSQSDRLAAGYCEAKPKKAGRSAGNAYCSTCSNCSKYAHCSSGGSLLRFLKSQIMNFSWLNQILSNCIITLPELISPGINGLLKQQFRYYIEGFM